MRYVTKEFLSPHPYESGHLICELSTPRVKDLRDYHLREDRGEIFGEVFIADCSKKVCLDFNATGQKAFDKRLAKFDNLIQQLTAARNQYQAMWENHQRDLKFYEQQKKQEAKK